MKPMSKTNAAYSILQEYKKPMKVKEIIDIALKRGMIEVNGKTPESTLASDLLQENRRKQKQNRPVRFKKVGPGQWTV
jgi:hypothetical protein